MTLGLRTPLAARTLATSLPQIGLALLLFYYPLAHVPPALLYRAMIGVPVLGLANERLFSAGVLLMPDFVLGLLVACAFWRQRVRLPTHWPATLVWLAATLTIAGGFVSLVYSDFVGVSSAGLAARVGVLALALSLLGVQLTSRALRLLCYSALAGTAIMCLIGAYTFFSVFGIPELTMLPILRSDPRYDLYERVTYGFPSNTVDLLVVTAPMAGALLMADQMSARARIFLVCCLSAMVVNLFIAFQRWGWFCITMDSAIIGIYWLRFRANQLDTRTKAVSLAAFAGAALLISSTIGIQAGYFARVLDATEASSLGSRAMTWREGIDAIAANPAGHGLGTANSLTRLTTTSSHNLLIDIGVEGGVLALIGASVWVCLHLWFLARILLGSADDLLSFALLLGAFSFVLFGVFFNSLLYLSGNAVWLAYWWLFPVMAIARRLQAERRRSDGETARREPFDSGLSTGKAHP